MIPADDENRARCVFVLESLAEMGEAVLSPGELPTMTRYLLRLMLGSLMVARGAVFILFARDSSLHAVARSGLPDPLAPIELEPGETRVLAALEGPLALAAAPPELARLAGELGRRFDVRALAPLAAQGQLLGLVALGRRFMGEGMEAADLRLAGVLSRPLTLALIHHRLIQDLRRTNLQVSRKILEMETLYDVGLALSSLKDPVELAADVLAQAASLIDASAGAVLLADSGEELQIAARFGFEASEPPPADLARALAAAAEGRDAAPPSPFLVVPLIGAAGRLGALCVAGKEVRRGQHGAFGGDDRRVLQAFGAQAAVALENARLHRSALERERLEKEVELAAAIQRQLLPAAPPVLAGYDLAGATEPSRLVGGDLHDFIWRPTGRLLLAIADVTGKGVPAAMLVSTLHAALHLLALHDHPLQELAAWTNRQIHSAAPDNRFAGVFLAELDPASGRLISVNAGQDPPVIVRAGGGRKKLETGGLIMGLMPDFVYQVEETVLAPGDLLVAATDGITETRDPDGEEFGMERVVELAAELADRPAGEIQAGLLAAVAAHAAGAPPADDRTLLILKRARR